MPLLLVGFGRSRDGSGIYPALWSAMLAARAEGIGSTLTGMLQSYFADEVMDILGVPKDAGWYFVSERRGGPASRVAGNVGRSAAGVDYARDLLDLGPITIGTP